MFAQWTTMTAEEVCRRLASDPRLGLSAAEVPARRRRWGEYALAESRRPSLLTFIINQYKDIKVQLLLGATLLT